MIVGGLSAALHLLWSVQTATMQCPLANYIGMTVSWLVFLSSADNFAHFLQKSCFFKNLKNSLLILKYSSHKLIAS